MSYEEPSTDDCWDALEIACKRKGNGLVYCASSGRTYWCTPVKVKMKIGMKLAK